MHEGCSRLWCARRSLLGPNRRTVMVAAFQWPGTPLQGPAHQAGSLRGWLQNPLGNLPGGHFHLQSSLLSTIVWSVSWSRHSGGAVTCSLCCCHPYASWKENSIQLCCLSFLSEVWKARGICQTLPDGPYIVVEKTHMYLPHQVSMWIFPGT